MEEDGRGWKRMKRMERMERDRSYRGDR